MLLHYLIISFRNLTKNKVQSAISIIGLAVGFTCFAFCSYALRERLDWDRSIKDADRICFIYFESDEGRKVCSYRYASEMLAKDFAEIESHTAYSQVGPYINKLCEVKSSEGKVNYFQENFFFTDSSFLDFFGVRLLTGDKKEIFQTPAALLLTEKTALKLFGTLDVIGKTFMDINDFNNKREMCTIRGVITNFPEHSSFGYTSGIELNTTNPYISNKESFMHYEAFSPFVKIREDTDLKQLNEKLKNYTLKCKTANNQTTELKVQLKPFLEFSSFVSNGEDMKPSLVLLTIGLLVLLTALINYVLFIFGRILNRIKECGIRKVSGAGKQSLFMLFFTEASMAFITACCLSLIIAELMIPYINSMQMFFTFDKTFLFRLLVQYSFAGIGCIALLCLFVTQKLGRISVIQSVYSDKMIRQNGIFRNLFICSQLVICFLFMGGTWFVRQQSELLESRLTAGLSEQEKTCIYEVSLNGDKLELVREDILRKLYENPNIELISQNGMSLFGAWHLGAGYFTWDGISEEAAKAKVGIMYTDSNYAELIRTPPTQGRFFTQNENDRAVVNESLARLFTGNPLNRQIGVKDRGEMKYYTITGILPDIVNNQNEMSKAMVIPCIYLPYPEGHINLNCIVKVRPGYSKVFPDEMKAELYKYVNQATPIYIENLNDSSGHYLYGERSLYKMTSVLSIICILISMLGIYSSVAIATEKRKREVAIRKINGATPGTILWIFSRNNLILLLVSTAIAFPFLILILNWWLENYSTRIPVSIIPFVLLFLLMGAVVALTVIWQIVRVARTNPSEVIKSE